MLYKYSRLLSLLKGYKRIAIAFSGGVDSSFLLYAACEAVGAENVLAITAGTLLHSAEELEFSRNLAEKSGVRFESVMLDPLAIEQVRFNRQDRCYHCKKAIFEALLRVASQNGYDVLAEGTNADDVHVYRPGLKAIAELGVFSPLKEAELTKREIRELSKSFGLETAKKPSRPCLATRLPYDTELTQDVIGRIGQGEKLLEAAGFLNFRLRHHGDLARLEIEPADFEALLSKRQEIVDGLRALGYRHITLDLKGFRSGSFDENQTRT